MEILFPRTEHYKRVFFILFLDKTLLIHILIDVLVFELNPNAYKYAMLFISPKIFSGRITWLTTATFFAEQMKY